MIESFPNKLNENGMQKKIYFLFFVYQHNILQNVKTSTMTVVIVIILIFAWKLPLSKHAPNILRKFEVHTQEAGISHTGSISCQKNWHHDAVCSHVLNSFQEEKSSSVCKCAHRL